MPIRQKIVIAIYYAMHSVTEAIHDHRIEIGRRATLVGAFVVCTTSVKHRRTTAGSNPRFQSRPKLLVKQDGKMYLTCANSAQRLAWIR